MSETFFCFLSKWNLWTKKLCSGFFKFAFEIKLCWKTRRVNFGPFFGTKRWITLSCGSGGGGGRHPPVPAKKSATVLYFCAYRQQNLFFVKYVLFYYIVKKQKWTIPWLNRWMKKLTVAPIPYVYTKIDVAARRRPTPWLFAIGTVCEFLTAIMFYFRTFSAVFCSSGSRGGGGGRGRPPGAGQKKKKKKRKKDLKKTSVSGQELLFPNVLHASPEAAAGHPCDNRVRGAC